MGEKKLKSVKASLKELLERDPEERRVYLEELERFRITLALLDEIEKAGISISELARRMGTSRAQLRRILSITSPHNYTLKTLQRFARALGLAVSVGFLPEDEFLWSMSEGGARRVRRRGVPVMSEGFPHGVSREGFWRRGEMDYPAEPDEPWVHLQLYEFLKTRREQRH